MPVKEELNQYYEQTIAALKEKERKYEFTKNFYQEFYGGKRSFYQKNLKETKKFDDEWIKTLESFFPSVEKIINNPRMTLRYEQDIVQIEKARKINSESVRHLASHTQYIKEFKDDQVIPKKILTTHAEEDIATYENRFIKTLLKRLDLFVERRYQIIKDNVESFEKQHFKYEADFNLADMNLKFNFDFTCKTEMEKRNKYNYDLLNRVEYLHTLVKSFLGSQFMTQMKNAKLVNPPIMKTNVILKNADFRNAYSLWIFLDRYSSLGYDAEVIEKNIKPNTTTDDIFGRLSLLVYSIIEKEQLNHPELEDLNSVREITKRSTKIAKSDPQDFVKNPDSIQVEDTLVLEYYLDEYKKITNHRMKEYLAEHDRYDIALKKVLRDTVEVTNNLYANFFELDSDDEDYFSRMVDDINPAEDYEKAKNKAKIAKIIREIKEKDYLASVKLEKKITKDIDAANRKMLLELKKRQRIESIKMEDKRYQKELSKIKEVRRNAKNVVAGLNKKSEIIAKNKTEAQEEVQAVLDKIKVQSKLIIEQKNKELKSELEVLKQKHEENLVKIKAEKLARREKNKKLMADKLAKVKADKVLTNKSVLEKTKAKYLEIEKKAKQAE